MVTMLFFVMSEHNFVHKIKMKLFQLFIYIFLISNVLAEDTTYSKVTAIKSTGKGSNASFQLSISGLDSATQITTSDASKLTLKISSATEDLGKSADIYNAVLVNKKDWWMLDTNGNYIPWNIRLKTLEPFREGVSLEEEVSLEFLSGKFNVTGELRYFFAYVAGDANYFVATPKAIKLNIVEGGGETSSAALSLYKDDVEEQIVQSKCIVCHVDGGLARNSDLRFSQRNELSAENNFDTFKSFLQSREGGTDYILENASGGRGHPGGVQLAEGGAQYKVLENVLRSIEDEGTTGNINFGSSVDSSADELNFFEGVVLESKEKTLRRAALILAGRIPTDAEIAKVRDGDESDFDEALLGLMEGEGFHQFLVEGTEDRLLIEGGCVIAGNQYGNWPLLQNKLYEDTTALLDKGLDPNNKVEQAVNKWLNKSAAELVAYVVENNRPYTEILTANYTMMTPLINEVFGGTAVFSRDDPHYKFKPGKITQYYYRSENEVDQDSAIAFGSVKKVSKIGKPVENYPHAGILSDRGFLCRYPTTPTNRNRARARWTLYHFLGIDVEKSTQRPNDPAALADTNNPTMNNSKCTVCHATLDPVAGAFQNWDERNMYRSIDGLNALDGFYISPPDGNDSLYEQGDTWYRDMRAPGLFEIKLKDQDYSLQELADLIVNEDAFYKATANFWWPSIFGDKTIDRPSVQSDSDYELKLEIYNAQQRSISDFSTRLKENINLKEMLVSMIKSKWFSADYVDSNKNQRLYSLAKLGNEQLLNPEQLVRKTQSLTGITWGRSLASPHPIFGYEYSTYGPYRYSLDEDYKVLFGGHDSLNVIERSESPNSLMAGVAYSQATSISCQIVAADFFLNKEERRLFTIIDESHTPVNDEILIKNQIIRLFELLHGEKYDKTHIEVLRAYQIFIDAFEKYEGRGGYDELDMFQDCSLSADMLWPELVGIDRSEYLKLNDINYWEIDNDKLFPLLEPVYSDKFWTKRAWKYVLIYMLSNYKYIVE